MVDLKEPAELVRQYLLPILADVASSASERHAITLGQGSNAYTYGTDIWGLRTQRFRDEAAKGSSFPFRVSGVRCVLEHGRYRFHHSRVGDSAADDIAVSFPKCDECAMAQNPDQMRFDYDGSSMSASPVASGEQGQFDFGDIGSDLETLWLEIAFMASPEDGLGAVYVAQPGVVDPRNSRHILSWAVTELVWRRSDVALRPSAAQGPLPPEVVADPVVRLRRRPAEGSADE